MAEQEQFDPSTHTVAEVAEYLNTADNAEQERVYQAERDGKARAGVLGDGGAQDPQEPQEKPAPTETKGATFQEAADAATPAEQGYIGLSPEAERTGRTDKGLSQKNPAVLNGDPLPDARPGVDDQAAIDSLKG